MSVELPAIACGEIGEAQEWQNLARLLILVAQFGQMVCMSCSCRVNSEPQNVHVGPSASLGAPHDEQRTTLAS